MIYFSEETNAPIPAIDLAKVLNRTSTPSVTPKWLAVPRPPSPIVPKPCASSTNRRKLKSFFMATISSSLPRSPFIPNTPSVMTRMPPPVSAAILVACSSCLRQAAISLCGNTKRLPVCRRKPSIMQACASESYTTTGQQAVDDRDHTLVTVVEQECIRFANESCQLTFELFVPFGLTAHHTGTHRGCHTIFCSGFSISLANFRMVGQT